MQQLVTGHRVLCQRVDGVQHRGGITRAAAQAGAHGDALHERDRHTKFLAGRREHGPGGAHRKVLFFRAEVRSVDRQRDPGRGTRHHNLVRELEQRERGLDLMVAVALARQNAQEQVELRVRGNAQSVRRGGGRAHEGDSGVAAALRKSLRCSCARDSASKPRRVIGIKLVMWKANA